MFLPSRKVMLSSELMRIHIVAAAWPSLKARRLGFEDSPEPILSQKCAGSLGSAKTR
jgi:hypothetical protein